MFTIKGLINYMFSSSEKNSSNKKEINRDYQRTLVPVKLEKDKPQYKSVEEIALILQKEEVRNIALTGPYGSGKSTILKTLRGTCTQYNYLQISLATLEASTTSNKEPPTREDSEKLNRRIEYSMLQQLIYREKYSKLPNSRFKRIFHLDDKKLYKWTVGITGFFLAYLVAFEPKFFIIDSLYNFFNLGNVWNSIFDGISAIYMLCGIFIMVKTLLRIYCGCRLNKLNLKNGEIEIQEETSIFNKHLDEIIYFFQATKYNVVIIEDLDRFNTPDIYLKLRELNQLLNESKEIARHIVFIYAVKDDVFKDASRVKFFDYISTVIPIINPSNSKNKLKGALKERGYEDIMDDDLEEIAFFINDMRLLINIANEYDQYRKRLCTSEQSPLDSTKLLGIIVYKNYYPDDFAALHNREGKVYACISSRRKYIQYAQKVLSKKKEILVSHKKEWERNNHLKKKDLRTLYIYLYRNAITKRLNSVCINNKFYDLDNIIDDETLFNTLILINNISYREDNSCNSYDCQINFKNIEKKVDPDCSYVEKLKAIDRSSVDIEKEEKSIESEELRIKSFKLKQLLEQFNMTECEDFTKIGLVSLMDIFLRRGYIDEEYYDYISYFYNDMVSQNDRDLLLTMKQSKRSDYTCHIEKIENFVKKAPYYIYNNNSILNNELVDFLVQHPVLYKENLELLMKRFEKSNVPMDFMAQYYTNSQNPEFVFSHFIQWDISESWDTVFIHQNEEERESLIEGWLRFCDTTKLLNPQIKWMNENYRFLTEHIEKIKISQMKLLVYNCKFTFISTNSSELLEYVVEKKLYMLNLENICLISNYLNGSNEATERNINLMRIIGTNNQAFIGYVEENIDNCIGLFSQTICDEDEKSILIIINNDSINIEKKRKYLCNQKNKILKICDVNDKYKDLAIELCTISPTWANIFVLFNDRNNVVSDILVKFIEKGSEELAIEECSNIIDNKEILFKELFGTNVLSITAFKKICNSFNCVFDGNAKIIDLEPERLDYLINQSKIKYSEKNIEIIQSYSDIELSKYLIHYKECFLKDVDKISFTTNLSLILLRSTEFTNKQKAGIVTNINVDNINNNEELATIICRLLTTEVIVLDFSVLKAILNIASDVESKLKVLTYTIENNSGNDTLIKELLEILPIPYCEITQLGKHPLLPKTGYNYNLLCVLKNEGYISSFKEDKEKRLSILYPKIRQRLTLI
jgi:hypothetical protein